MTKIRASQIAAAQIIRAGRSILDIIERHLDSEREPSELMVDGMLLQIRREEDGFVCLHSEFECRKISACPRNDCPKF